MLALSLSVTAQASCADCGRRMNSGRKGVPPPGQPAPTDIASTQVDARRSRPSGAISIAQPQPRQGTQPPAPPLSSVSPCCSLAYTQYMVVMTQSSRDARDSEAGGRHPKTEAVVTVVGVVPAPEGGAHKPRLIVPTPAPQDTNICATLVLAPIARVVWICEI